MLKLTVVSSEDFDEAKNEFVPRGVFELELEHSLVSLSKWESRFEKPYLSKTPKTSEEAIAYIRCMILTPDVPDDIVNRFSEKNFDDVNEYITSKQTATWFAEPKGRPKPSTEQITAELIYYWMTAYQIPWEAQYWHLEKLFTLIKVFNAKNDTKKKMSRQEAAAQQRSLNEQRKAQYNTKG